MMDVTMSFCVGERFRSEHVGHIFVRLDLSNAVQPILYSRAVYDVCEDLLVRGPNEDKKRGFIASTDFGGQAGLCQYSNELLELFYAGFFVCGRSVFESPSAVYEFIPSLGIR